MALYSTDYAIRPEDGWTLVATNPGVLVITPNTYHAWYVAITDTGAPAATVLGTLMGNDDTYRLEPFVLPNGVTGAVYVRVVTPPNSDTSSKFTFNVVAANGGSGSGGSPTMPLYAVQPNFDASGTQLTRPANMTPYSIGDSISNNATAGSVTALVVTVSDTNDQPVILEEILVTSSDTGPGTAGAQIRVHVFGSDPTANSGVVGGDNAAWSNKQAGWRGSFSGTMTLFSDGSRGKLAPDSGNVLMTKPGTGAKTIWFQYQTLSAFTPSANSSTFDAQFKGWQGRLTS